MSVPALMRRRGAGRLIAYDPAEVPKGGSEVVASCATPVKRVGQEAAGHSFHAAALKYVEKPSEEGDEEPLPEEEDAKLDDPAHVHPSSWEGTKKKKGAKGSVDQHDHYQLLGLGHLRYLANDDQIKKAYRATSLKHHPDKQAAVLLDFDNEEEKDAKREELDNHFKLIQEAYEVLTDPAKRRLFDSIDEFDDDIPDACEAKDFYKLYGPVFQRNSRWSMQQPCPQLGDDSTPHAEVDAFYDFWFLFKSWREFPQEDEYELDQAEGREHKRWMERQNAKLREKAKKEEVSRIRELVENAYKRDPRVARMKEEEKKEKQKKKLAKQASKRAAEEEAARKVEEERLAKEAAEAAAADAAREEKKQREKDKKLVRKERQRLRAAAGELPKGVTAEELEELLTGFDLMGLRRVCDEVEGAGGNEGKTSALRRGLQRLRDPQAVQDEPAAAGPSAAPAAEAKEAGTSGKGGEGPGGKAAGQSAGGGKAAASAASRAWSSQETALLKKALLKYPRGTRNRWEVVATMCGRSVEEVIATQKNELQKKPEDDKAFLAFLEQRKAPPKIKSPLTDRADVGDAPKAGVENGGKAGGEQTANGGASAANGAAAGDDAWSEGQEVALVKALKAFPKETPARWERIMQAVPGKTKAQCFKKFQTMRESFRAKKAEGE